MVDKFVCRRMTEDDIDRVVPMYMEHYNTYDSGTWTPETTHKRIHKAMEHRCCNLRYRNAKESHTYGF